MVKSENGARGLNFIIRVLGVSVIAVMIWNGIIGIGGLNLTGIIMVIRNGVVVIVVEGYGFFVVVIAFFLGFNFFIL